MNLAPSTRTRILIVDDSAVIRTVISRTLSAHLDFEIVGIAFNGKMGVETISSLKPDVVILDIEMPIMDGITALPLILKEKPDTRVLICSTLSARGADISIKALSLGAAECILKPGGEAIISAHEFQDELVRLVRNLAPPKNSPTTINATSNKKPISLKTHALTTPQIVAIGSSTGGPKALMDIMGQLNNLPVPIVITQHMPKTFTQLLAQHITQTCRINCEEGKEGEVIQPGRAYIAPGGFHMTFKKSSQGVTIHMNEDPPENFCRPSVNPMLRSLIPIYGSKILCVMLTGMGNDGSQVCTELVAKGGTVIAQDEATSVVWGMPGAVANAGLCSAVIPLNQIAGWVNRATKGAV